MEESIVTPIPRQELADAIRQAAAQREALSTLQLCDRFGLTAQELADELATLWAHEEYGDLRTFQGSRQSYYYASPILADNYVRALVLAEEGDLTHTIAEIARYDSQTYPRPTEALFFTRFPYRHTAIEVKRALERMAGDSRFTDIVTYTSEKGNLYVFSTRFITPFYGKKLVEYAEDDSMHM